MKKVSILILLLLLPIKVLAISASSAIVMDLNTDRIYYEHNIHEERLIASITKIMTCIVAIENADLDKEITVGDEIYQAFGSAIYIEVGEKLKLKDLLLGLMLRSGNDAAMVIAKNVGGGIDNFVYMMNEMAANIGMKNTKFYNPHGLENDDGIGNISTAYDMALLTKYAMQNKTFREIFGTKKVKVKSSYKTYTWESKNKLIHRYDFITGGKTGFTKKARRTLVTTAKKDNIELVVVTLNDGNDFQDHISLYNQVFEKFETIKVLDKNKFKIKKDNYYQDYKLYIKDDVYISLLDKEKKNIKINYILTKNKNVMTGDVVGKAEVYIKDKKITEAKIYVKVPSKEKLSFWEKLVRWFKW